MQWRLAAIVDKRKTILPKISLAYNIDYPPNSTLRTNLSIADPVGKKSFPDTTQNNSPRNM